MKKIYWLVVPLLLFFLYNYYNYQKDYYDGSRFVISKYEGKYWLHDEGEGFTIEKDGQSLKRGKRYIYSYGKGGFVIIDKKLNKLKVVFDGQTNDFQKNSIENQEKMNPQYIQIVNPTDLTESEKDMYTKLRNINNAYGTYPQTEFLKDLFLTTRVMQIWNLPFLNGFFLDGLVLWFLFP